MVNDGGLTIDIELGMMEWDYVGKTMPFAPSPTKSPFLQAVCVPFPIMAGL